MIRTEYRPLDFLRPLIVLLASSAMALAAPWKIVKPSTTGIPGEELRLMAFDPAGNLWVVGRFYFWEEVGIAQLPAADVPYQPLPSGGFDTGCWTVWSNLHHPIPSLYIYDIEFGADGIIWLSSEGGLTRFDPNATTPSAMWHTYDTTNSPLILNDVRALDQDSQGSLWLTNTSVLSSHGALFKFNPATEQWTKFVVGQQLPWFAPWLDLNEVFVGADDRVWLTHSTLTGLVEFNGTSWVLHDNGVRLDGMVEDAQGNVWITSAEDGLWKWNGTAFQNFYLGAQGTVTAVGCDPTSGLVYASNWYGDTFKMLNGISPAFVFNADNIPGSIIIRPDGDIWINNYGGNGTLGTVRHYAPSGQLLERLNTYNTGLPDYFMENIQCDRNGNLWFACGEGGLSRYDGQRWRNWGNHNDLSEPYPFAGNEPMYAILEDQAGNIWMGGNGVARWNPSTETFTGFWNWQNSAFGVDDMRCLAEAADGAIWVGTGYSGAYRYDAPSNNWISYTWGPSGSTANDVVDMTTDNQGNLWILTYVELHRLSGQTWTTWDSSNSPLVPGDLLCLEAARAGGIWLGAVGNLFHFDGDTWWTTTAAQAGWPGSNVSGIDVRGSDGLLAVTTQQPSTWPYTGGISVYDGTTWTHWTPQNSPLTHWQCSAPQFDAKGHLWASPMSTGVAQILIGLSAGDINGDGDINAIDASLFVGVLVGTNTNPIQVARSDVDGDGKINGADVQALVNGLLAP